MSLPASHAAVKSASVLECAIVSWYFVLYPTIPPAYSSAIPVTDFLCCVSTLVKVISWVYSEVIVVMK
jgi:hypothetical protein